MPTTKAILVRALNVANNQSLAPSDFTFGKPTATATTDQAVLTLMASSSGTIPYAGKAKVKYQRLNLDTVFALVNRQVTVSSGDTLYTVLNMIRRRIGISLTSDDVDDATLDWTNGTTTVNLVAKNNSLTWTGSSTITLTQKVITLASVYTKAGAALTSAPYTQAMVLAAANKANQIYIPLSALTVDAPVDTTTAGLSTTYNTALKITAVAGSGFSGSAYLYYNRHTLSSVFGTSFTTTAHVSDTVGLLPYLLTIGGNVVTAADISNETISYDDSGNGTVGLTAASSSLTYNSTTPITVIDATATEQQIVINLTADDTAYTAAKLQKAITDIDNGQPSAKITINISKNVTIIGADPSNPTFALTNYGTLKISKFVINNYGSIYGRGGTGGYGSGSGGVGGTAIDIAGSNTKLTLNNQGRIAGGGGGGGGAYKGAQVYGGGGAPLGTSGTSTAAKATETTPAAGQSYYSYPNQADGGSGAGVAGDGVQGRTYDYSSKTTTTLANGGKAGVAITGLTGQITFATKGVIVPLFATTDTTNVNGIVQQPTAVYLEPGVSSKSVLYFGVVTPANFITTDDLRTAVGMTQDTALTPAAYHKFHLDGKPVMVPVSPVTYGTQWTTLYNLGLVYGDNTTGTYPPSGASVTQYKEIKILGVTYSVRLLHGANVDPVPGTGSGTVGMDLATTVGSEWNRLLYMMSSKTLAAYTGPKTPTTYSDSQLGVATGASGSVQWAIEKHLYDDSDRRVTRGGGAATASAGVNALGANLLTDTSDTYGWRPLLVAVKYPDETEYKRFVTWLAKQSYYVSPDSEVQTNTTSMTSNRGVLVSKKVLAGNGTLVGSPYGEAFARSTTFGSVARHAYPSYDQFREALLNARVCMFIFNDPANAVLTALTRNGLASTGGTTAQTCTNCTRFIYFDTNLSKMMEYNPSTMSTPIEFVFS